MLPSRPERDLRFLFIVLDICIARNCYITRRLTHLILGQDPADCPDPSRCPDNSVEGNLSDWNKGNLCLHRIDNIVVENVVVGVD